MQKLSIIIPAYNEANRIKGTLEAYIAFFADLKQQHMLDFELLVVLNACTDNTLSVVQEVQTRLGNCLIIQLNEGGKGLAIQVGFANALERKNDLIGFVDADMATSPQAFFDLVKNIESYDGIIASRYMPGAHIYPPRPWIKRWGSRLVYESLVKLLFGLHYHDFQCGAKVFKRYVIAVIIPYLYMKQWAFDVELLYLCKKFGFSVREFPTTWYDKEGSKLRLSAGMSMLSSLVQLRWRHSIFSQTRK